jgi:hypothetical protein
MRRQRARLCFSTLPAMYVQNPLSMKHFQGVSSGSPHVYLLKSCIGKVRWIRNVVVKEKRTLS